MSYNVSFIYEVKDRISGTLSKIASAVSSVNARIEQNRAKFDKAGNSISGIHAKIQTLEQKRNSSKAVSEIGKINLEIRKLEKEADKLKNLPPESFFQRIKKANGGFATMAKAGLAFFGITAGFQLGKSFVNLGLDMEQTRAKFEVLLGSAEKGNAMIKDINDMANATPFDNEDLMKSSELMLAFGISQEKILPTMQMLGDISMGNKDKLASLTLAFAQSASTGKLTGQDLLQMINAGFNPLNEIAKKTGKSVEKLKDEMGKGLITFDMVEDAFKSATEAGGQFHGMMDKMSNTNSGKLSNIVGAFKAKMTELSERLSPFISKILDFGLVVVNNFDKIAQAIWAALTPVRYLVGLLSQLVMFFVKNRTALIALVAAVVAYKAQMALANSNVKMWIKLLMKKRFWVDLTTKAIRGMNAALKSNAIGLAIAGVAALITWLISLRKRTRETVSEVDNVKRKANEYASQERANLDMIFAKLSKTNPKSKERNELVKQLREQYPDLLKNMDLEAAGLEDLKKAYDKIVESIERKAMAQAVEERMTELYKEKNDNIIAYKENTKAVEKALKEYENLSKNDKILMGGVKSFVRDEYTSKQLDLRVRNMEIDKSIEELKGLINVENYTKAEDVVSADFGSAGGKDGGKSVSGLTSGGSKATNVTINLRNLIEHLNLSSATLPEGVDNITNHLIEGLLRALNSATKIPTN